MLEDRSDVTHFAYDALGRLIAEEDALHHLTDYRYNQMGQRVGLIDANGNQQEYHYDALNRLDWVHYLNDAGANVRFEYDVLDRRTVMEDALGLTTWAYDLLGRILSIDGPLDGPVSYTYDIFGNRASLTYPDEKSVEYGYDGMQRLTNVRDWEDRQTEYEYDPAGRLATVYLPNGMISTYGYDPLGRLEDISHERDSDGKLIASYHYDYDANGNRVQAVEFVSQAVNAETLPETFTSVQSGYSAINLAWPDSSINEDGYTLERSADGIHWQTVADLGADTFRYLDEGLARHTFYLYRLTAYSSSDGSLESSLQAETAFDPITYPVAEQTSINYEYDGLQRLTQADYDSGLFYHYTYDAAGNRLAETTAFSATTSVYDVANRLTSVGGTAYTWDDNGNLLSDGLRSYVYDRANRLTSVTQGSDITTYAYNGLGDRVSETVNEVPNNFVLDLNTGLTQVLADDETTYLYGNGRIGQFAGADSAYFLGDALGSVRQLVDEEGTVTLAKAYDPYGEVMSSVGAGASAYEYTGEMQDLSTTLLYLRARYYEPNGGRFLSRDTWAGDEKMPISYNAWLYGYSNPVLYTDPTGQTPAIVAALLPALVGGAAGFIVGAAAGGIYGACVYELALAGQCGCEMQQQALSMTKQDWIGAHALGAGIIGGVGGAIAAYGPVGMIAVGVAGVVISGVDIINTYNIIKNETGLTTCTVTRLIVDVTAMVFSGVGIVKGVRAWRASGSPLKWVGVPPSVSPEGEYVGYHGTSSVYADSIQKGINPPKNGNFLGNQLGEGFYVTRDLEAAMYFADIAADNTGGTPVILKVYARGFSKMGGVELPRSYWWNTPSEYVNNFDYVTAPISGLEQWSQIKFNPKVYNLLQAVLSD